MFVRNMIPEAKSMRDLGMDSIFWVEMTPSPKAVFMCFKLKDLIQETP
jgi:hypothetical protein